MKNILVTGGAGFIGSNLTDFLLSENCRVTVLDNFSTGKRENIEHLYCNRNFTLIEGDIRDPETCAEAVKGIDYVFHEAASGSVPRSLKDPATTIQVNVYGFVNMLTAVKNAGVKRFIYASSSSVYGSCQDSPKVEERIGKPLSPYALSKSMDEQIAEIFSSIYGIECIGLRYFNVYGKRQDPNGDYAAVIPKFSAKLIAHQQPTINGDGSFSRDFTFIEDVIQANMLAMTTENKNAVNTVYNVAFGATATLNELFDALKNAYSRFDPAIAEISPVYGPERAGDIPHSFASTKKAEELLGYSPAFDLQNGLEQTAKWYFENIKSKL